MRHLVGFRAGEVPGDVGALRQELAEEELAEEELAEEELAEAGTATIPGA